MWSISKRELAAVRREGNVKLAETIEFARESIEAAKQGNLQWAVELHARVLSRSVAAQTTGEGWAGGAMYAEARCWVAVARALRKAQYQIAVHVQS